MLEYISNEAYRRKLLEIKETSYIFSERFKNRYYRDYK